MFVFGIIGFFLEKIKFPIATVILGVVLGPLAENEFRRALQMAGGDYTVFFQRPISAVLLVAAIVVLVLPFIRNMRQNRSKADIAA